MWKNWALHTLLVGTDHDSDIVEKQIWQVLQDISIDSLADPAVPVLGVTEERWEHQYIKKYIYPFTAALLIIAENTKQPPLCL